MPAAVSRSIVPRFVTPNADGRAGVIVVGFTIGRQANAIAANFGPPFWPASRFIWALIPIMGTAMTGSIAASDLWYQVGFAAGEVKRPERAIGYPVLPALYFIATAGLCVILLIRKPQFTWPGLMLVASGVPMYAIWRAKRPVS